MARYHVVYWGEIPTLVQAEDDQGVARVPLGDHFLELVDAVAMARGRASTEEYLAQWRNGAPAERPGTAREVAEAVAGELAASYDSLRARLLLAPSG